MSKLKLTPWYQPDVLPARPGIYEVDYNAAASFEDYQYFDGKDWYYGSDNVEEAMAEYKYFADIRCHKSNPRRWRGILKD